MARDTWYRLDTVGKYYSSQAGNSHQTVFRFSATAKDEVNESALQRAVEKTVGIFPSFNVCLRSGMFWHYLEPAPAPPVVSKENLPICFGLHVDVKSVLFRVSYYRNRINLEVSHIVSDGRGTMNFFKTLLSFYAQERYGIEGIPLEYDGSNRQKSEHSFDKYYERKKPAASSKQATANSPHKARVYRLTGWRDTADPTYLEYHLPSQSVLNIARSHDVSVTSLIIASIMHSIYGEMPLRERHRPIRFDIPVDLRQVFDSSTTSNFFGMTFVSYAPSEEESVEDIAKAVHKQLKVAIKPEQLKVRMNRLTALEKNPFLRLAPLFLKDIVLEIAGRLNAREATTTVSNLGIVHLDERVSPYFSDINILSSTTGLNFTLCSLGEDLCIGISTVYTSLDIVRRMCRYYSAAGIKGHINISKTIEEADVNGQETKSEASVKHLGGKAPATDKDSSADEISPSGKGSE